MASIGEIKSDFLKSLYKKFHASQMAAGVSNHADLFWALTTTITQDMITRLSQFDKCLERGAHGFRRKMRAHGEVYQLLLAQINRDTFHLKWSLMSLTSEKDVLVCFDDRDLIGLIMTDGVDQLRYYCHPSLTDYIIDAIETTIRDSLDK